MIEKRFDVIIVGGGPAGMCAALYAGRGMLNTLLIERGAHGGELLNTELIEDYPGFESILGRELAVKMSDHAKRFGAAFLTDTVESVRKQADGQFEVKTEMGKTLYATAVIVTAGGTPSKLGVPGEKEFAGRGVSYCAVCDGAFFRGDSIAVVGGGDAAVEEAGYLTRYAEKVTVIHRREEFRASAILQKRLFANPRIDVIWNTVVDSVEGGERGMTGLNLRNTASGATSTLPVTGLFVFIGFKPNTGIIQDHVRHDESGYIITDDHMMTTVPGLFVAGDMRHQLTRQITTAVGDATTAAIAVEKYIAARKETAGVGAS